MRAEVEQALGLSVESVLALYEGQTIQELLAILPNEAAVRAYQPDLAAVARLLGLGFLVSAPGDEHDFVSRYFAPSIGIDEDQVNGSTHCIMTPYWAQRLDKSRLSALQCSARGGELHCELAGERVKIAGQALLIASGRLLLA